MAMFFAQQDQLAVLKLTGIGVMGAVGALLSLTDQYLMETFSLAIARLMFSGSMIIVFASQVMIAKIVWKKNRELSTITLSLAVMALYICRMTYAIL
jgi:hypothetical protein